MTERMFSHSWSSGGSFSWTRRLFLQRTGQLAVAFVGLGAPQPPAAHAAPLVTVAPSLIVRGDACRATATVHIALTGIRPDTRMVFNGELLETDDPDGDPDLCTTFPPQFARTPREQPFSVILKQDAMSAELGLVKGVGPAEDETNSPDLVELVARIWLRDLTTGHEYGPWLSPTRVAVASAALAWRPDAQSLTSTLLGPQGAMQRGPSHLPRLACAP